MLEEIPNGLSKVTVKDRKEGEQSGYNQKNIVIGIVHSLIIPFSLGWLVGVEYAWAYVVCMSILYATVFIHKPTAGIFFAILFPFVCFALLFLVPIAYHENIEELIKLSHIILK